MRGFFIMNRLTVEYEVIHDGHTPDKVILAAIRQTPVELTLKDPNGGEHLVQLNPDVVYPSTFSA